ncbi:UBP25 [Symbiodinium natans]|uniref:UBP25 protein n=1 Tax=Symbiodinium natans TaxID=878477 RepID=A0A812PDZ3_9DINO|nr:UBP25 [Symbiodinium natans]
MVMLTPHLEVLNEGKGSQSDSKDTGSFRSVKKRRTGTSSAFDSAPATDEQLVAAVKAFYNWCQAPKSPLRSMLFLLSGGNTFYTSHCAGLVARACIQHKPMTE